MSINEKTPSFNDQFEPPLVPPDFFQRARCAGCSARLTHFAALVAVPTNTRTSRIVPLCPGCHSHTCADRPTGDDLEKTLGFGTAWLGTFNLRMPAVQKRRWSNDAAYI
jgi:hypothetical protein